MVLRGLRNTFAVRKFREFRYTRPFWGALFVLVAGLEIGFLPLGPTDALIRAGKGAFTALACSGLLLVMGLVILFLPTQRMAAGIIAVLVSLASFPLSNLGGFVVGMLLGIVGGSLAFGWVPDKDLYRRNKGGDAPHRRPLPSPTATVALAGATRESGEDA
jgi:hypothetical protein